MFIQHKVFHTAAGQLAYSRYGHVPGKPLVVFFHGLGGSDHSLKYIAPLVHETINLLGLCLPFHGATSLRGSKASGKQFGLLVNEVMEKLAQTIKPERIVFCAHSIGTHFALHTALDTAHKIDALLLLAPAAFGSKELRFFRVINSSLGRLVLKSDTLVRAIAAQIWQPQQPEQIAAFPRQLGQSFLHLSEFELHLCKRIHELYRIDYPVHLLWAKDDSLLPYTQAEDTLNHFRFSKLHLLQHGKHHLIKTRPEKVAQHLLELSEMPTTFAQKES